MAARSLAGKVALVTASTDGYVPAPPIDYRCANGRFSLSSRGFTISNRRSLSSSETVVGAEIRS
jgi:hypothetical protein